MIRCLIFVLLVIAATAAEQKKTQKASRVQNQEPIVSDIFLGVSQITCPPNQFWNTCPVLPEPSCQNPWPRCPQFCPIGARCQCRPGFYRATSAPNAPCVPWLTCWRFPWPRSNPLVPVATIAGRPQCWWGGPRTFPGIPG
ncbi:hypothetical protein PRIPAC_81825 [Pristionchus pacificus]|uniref:TIL domain-containing protein n=1 Tax=Pristionchus pacificus TaxID=54126 RepID=A0A2A6CKT9_PRIPA|nr:hypothetical protein PRIPAC_81825 [Pristionchus pacificus]|eukprot:PDM78845.1 hypothetical protein PRIPAC_31424 [Pristionchus pacificus]